MLDVVSRRFQREKDDVDSERPLHRALEWAQRIDRTCDYVVFAHETEDLIREYEVIASVELEHWANECGHERHAHEVIAWPTKLYGDIDVKPPTSDVEEQFSNALRALVAAAEQKFGVTCDEPLVLDASVRNEKFSRHFVINMCRNGESVRFASVAHCGAFVRSVPEAFALCDFAVYTHNSTLRTYGSTKINAPTRVLWPLGVSRTKRLDYATLERSLVTWPRVRESHRLITLEIDVSVKTRSRPRSLAASTSSCHSNDGEFVESIEAVRDSDVVNVRRSDTTGMLLVNVRSKLCAQKGAAHNSNTIFFIVDDARGRYKQLCHSPKCSNVGIEWHLIDDVLAPSKRARSSDAIDALRHRDCIIAKDDGKYSRKVHDNLLGLLPPRPLSL